MTTNIYCPEECYVFRHVSTDFQSAKRTADSSPAVHCWDRSEESLVREADDWQLLDIYSFSHPLHGLRYESHLPSDESLGYCQPSANCGLRTKMSPSSATSHLRALSPRKKMIDARRDHQGVH